MEAEYRDSLLLHCIFDGAEDAAVLGDWINTEDASSVIKDMETLFKKPFLPLVLLTLLICNMHVLKTSREDSREGLRRFSAWTYQEPRDRIQDISLRFLNDAPLLGEDEDDVMSWVLDNETALRNLSQEDYMLMVHAFLMEAAAAATESDNGWREILKNYYVEDRLPVAKIAAVQEYATHFRTLIQKAPPSSLEHGIFSLGARHNAADFLRTGQAAMNLSFLQSLQGYAEEKKK